MPYVYVSIHIWQDIAIIGEIEKQKKESHNTKRQSKQQAVRVQKKKGIQLLGKSLYLKATQTKGGKSNASTSSS